MRLGLLGVSGAGKSSILNVLSGQVRPQGDCVELFGLDLKKPENMYLVKRHVSLCPQLNENVVDGLSVYENIKFVLLLKGFDKNYQNIDQLENFTVKDRIQQLLDRFGLSEHRYKTTWELSGGMLRRLSLCNAIVSNHKLFILDEITSGLDPFSCQMIDQEISRIESSFVLSTHDMKQVKRLCNYMLIMRKGRVQCENLVHAIQLQYGKISLSLYFDQALRALEKDDIVQLLDTAGF